jgi:dihydrofolate reductase
MGRLITSATASLDGYVADADGGIAWSAPSDEVHAFVNDQLRSVGTYLFGRRMYEVMRVWEDPATVEGPPAPMRGFAELWHAADKVVYSTTLGEVTTANTVLERSFDPEQVRELVAASERDVEIGGPTLAAHAFRAGLVEEVRLFVAPVVLGGGTPYFPDDLPLDLELVDERRFADGTVFLRYAVR